MRNGFRAPGVSAWSGRLRGHDDERVTWQRRILQLGYDLRAGNGKPPGIDETGLNQHRGLIPVDVLARDLAIFKADDRDCRDLDPATGRWHSRQNAVNRTVMGKADQ